MSFGLVKEMVARVPLRADPFEGIDGELRAGGVVGGGRASDDSQARAAYVTAGRGVGSHRRLRGPAARCRMGPGPPAVVTSHPVRYIYPIIPTGGAVSCPSLRRRVGRQAEVRPGAVLGRRPARRPQISEPRGDRPHRHAVKIDKPIRLPPVTGVDQPVNLRNHDDSHISPRVFFAGHGTGFLTGLANTTVDARYAP